MYSLTPSGDPSGPKFDMSKSVDIFTKSDENILSHFCHFVFSKIFPISQICSTYQICAKHRNVFEGFGDHPKQ